MATLTINACRPAQPPSILFRRWRTTLKVTGAPVVAQDRGAAGGGDLAAALDLCKIPPAVTTLEMRG